MKNRLDYKGILYVRLNRMTILLNSHSRGILKNHSSYLTQCAILNFLFVKLILRNCNLSIDTG